ncbi:UNVERIFIED_CONTAM: hypothetical protein FKN15_064797 [Acipenser sinensis]
MDCTRTKLVQHQINTGDAKPTVCLWPSGTKLTPSACTSLEEREAIKVSQERANIATTVQEVPANELWQLQAADLKLGTIMSRLIEDRWPTWEEVAPLSKELTPYRPGVTTVPEEGGARSEEPHEGVSGKCTGPPRCTEQTQTQGPTSLVGSRRRRTPRKKDPRRGETCADSSDVFLVLRGEGSSPSIFACQSWQ